MNNRTTRIVILTVTSMVLLLFLGYMVSALEPVLYARNYAIGHVSSGFWSQDQGTRFFLDAALKWLGLLVFGVAGILGIMGVLLKLLSFAEHHFAEHHKER